jgi:hypothetical protein
MTDIEEEVSAGRDVIHLGKGGCGGRKQIKRGGKSQKHERLQLQFEKEFQRN